jgi:hypothetical protein
MKNIKEEIVKILEDYHLEENWRKKTDEQIVQELLTLFQQSIDTAVRETKKEMVSTFHSIILDNVDSVDERKELYRAIELLKK